MATKDWAYRRKAGDGRRDLVQDTVHFLDGRFYSGLSLSFFR